LEEGDLEAWRANSPVELDQIKMALGYDRDKSIFVHIENTQQVLSICLVERWRQCLHAINPFNFANLSIVVGV